MYAPITDPTPGNPLAAPMTPADVADYNAPTLRDAYAAAASPQFWVDAARQYGQGLLAGSVAPGGGVGVMANPAFRKWFGASKAVDETGMSVVHYHGTNSDFDAFQRIDGGNQYGSGYYFTKSPENASAYATGDVNRITPAGNAAPNVIPAYLAYEKPFMRRALIAPSDLAALEKAANKVEPSSWKRGELAAQFDKAYPPNGDNVAYALGRNANEIIQRAGFDAHVAPDMTVVFDPTQIKSAIGNRGTFSPTDPRITYGAAGLAGAAAAGGADQQ